MIEWIEKKIDKIENKLEMLKWNRLIKKACKKYYVTNENRIKMYIWVQREVLRRVNDTGFESSPFITIINQRLFDLNREFIFLINGKFYNSLSGLVRQIIELFIRLLEYRYDKHLPKKLFKEIKQKPIKNIIEELKNKATFPYNKGIGEREFLDVTLFWFNFFSNIIHISGVSFSKNIFITNFDKGSIRYYIQKPNIKDGESLVVFSKDSSVSPQDYQILIQQFYLFSCYCLLELDLIIKNYNGKDADI